MRFAEPIDASGEVSVFSYVMTAIGLPHVSLRVSKSFYIEVFGDNQPNQLNSQCNSREIHTVNFIGRVKG